MDPGNCGLEGIYRGLRIDNLYRTGEWQATFASRNNSETVAVVELDQTGGSLSAVQGTLECSKACTEGTTDAGAPFTLTTSSGAVQHGICGYMDQNQAETSGLLWALSAPGAAAPPAGFDVAMLNTSNATVFTYYKCADYKRQACTFVAV